MGYGEPFSSVHGTTVVLVTVSVVYVTPSEQVVS